MAAEGPRALGRQPFPQARPAKLARCRPLLAALPPEAPATPDSLAGLLLRVTGVDITRCPVCRQGRLHRVGAFPPGAPLIPVLDTSSDATRDLALPWLSHPAPGSPFPPGPGWDTIPIAFSPAVQFNPFYPAGSSPVTGGFFRSGPAG